MELGRLSSPRADGAPTQESGSKRDDVRLLVSDEPLKSEIGAPVPAAVKRHNGVMQGDESTPLLDSGGAGETLAEMEIQSLLWIKMPGNEKLREALETWQAKDALFASRVDKKRKQSNSFRNEVYQLIGFYSVFQGVLLTAVAQSNMLLCHNWWTAFFLSLLASLVATAGVILKFRSIWALEATIGHEEVSRKECIRRVQKMLQNRERFTFKEHAKDSQNAVPKQTKLKVSAGLVVAVLLLFSALFLASIFQILCDPGSSDTTS